MSITSNELLTIARQFCLDTPAVDCAPYGNGLINKTYYVTTESGQHYILQQLSEEAFHDIPALMNNVSLIADYLSKQNEGTEKESIIVFPIRTVDGGTFIHTENGYYRMTPFAEGTIALDAPESAEDFYQSAVGFGSFISELKDFPAETLVETIPNFHNTADRYRIFHEALEKDVCGRAKDIQPEVEFLLAREKECSSLQQMRDDGTLPTRVTHNDTKLNNVLLDAKTRTPKYVIDLDTVMPGLSLYDYGDCIRFGACTAAEDEPDTSKIDINLDLFRIFTKGFLESCKGLTDLEIELLPLGAKTITVELAMRFLTDYLNGDVYFGTKYAGHNLVRCRAQEALAVAMEKKFDRMKAIVAEENAKA